MKSGFVAVVGRPNVGKSTLVNRLVGEKVSITSSRPQTTRNVIRGVVHGDGHQIVLVDTPGLHKPRNELGERLNALVYGSFAETDLSLFLIDATAAVGPGDQLIAGRLAESDTPVYVVVNKVDVASRGQVVEQLAKAGEWGFDEYFPIAARTGDGVDALTEAIVEVLPEGPEYFPPSMTSDQPESIVLAELIREKFLERLHDELPHALVVVVDDIEERDDGIVDVRADVIVERESQKGIVIGRGGAMLREAGSEAREEIERILASQVNLQLRVSVEKDWQRKPLLLDRLGFQDG